MRSDQPHAQALPGGVCPGGSLGPGKRETMQHRVDVGQPYLFLDDEFIAQQSGVVRRLGKVIKHGSNPILKPDRPWEGICTIIWGSVLWDPCDNRFRMWYQTYNPHTEAHADQTLLCYAESQDGIEWDKPSLGLVEYRGSTDNNIVHRTTKHFDTATIIIDPFGAADDARYKMMLFDTDRCQFLRYTSGDGLGWRLLGAVDNLGSIGDRHSLLADVQAGHWTLYHKQNKPRRTVCMATSEDFENWTEHGEVLVPDANDRPETQFYGMVGFREGCFGLGFLEVFHILDRRLDTQLVRLDEQGRPSRFMQGEAFLTFGQWCEWDSTWVFPGNCEPIRFGEEIRIYYQGRNTLHWAGSHARGHIGAVGLARLRPNGWVYLEGTAHDATLTTEPIEMTGNVIHMNVDAAGQSVCAELLDESGRPLEGFTADQCCPIENDVTYSKLNWGGTSRFAEMVGRTVRVRLHLGRAKLYSFAFSDRHY
jgi:hypothetical protein